MDKKLIIFYIIVIIIILFFVFWSQQAYSRAMGKNLISAVTDQAVAYLTKGSDWAMSQIYPKISGQVQKRGDTITNLGTQVENYFSGIANSILHPGKKTEQNNNCLPSQTPAGQ